MTRLWLALLVVLTVSSCRGGCAGQRSDVLAILLAARGSVERDVAARVGSWTPAAPESEFRVGDAVRTRESASAELELDDRSRVKLEPNTTLRFLATPPGAEDHHGLDVLAGEAVLEVGDRPSTWHTGGTVARLEAGARVKLKRSERGVELEVLLGDARIDTTDGPVSLRRGGTLTLGAARPPPEPAATTASTQAAAVTGSSQLDTLGVQSRAHADLRVTAGPSYADVQITAGESLNLNDAAPPTAVGVRWSSGSCPGDAVVELLRASGRKPLLTALGRTGANLLVPAGAHRYRLRCLGEDGRPEAPIAEGKLTILRNAGTAALPRTPPRTLVDVDGRSYTVLYQNLLPIITVRWRDAPKSGPYRLTLTGGSAGPRTVTASSPRHTFTSGQLPEGSYQVVFEAAGKRSSATTLRLRFDNAAPAASITSPADRSFAPGDDVLVAGVALPGWSVFVNGRAIELDEQWRFSANLAAPADTSGLLIRFTHPTRGSRAYLRRPKRGATP